MFVVWIQYKEGRERSRGSRDDGDRREGNVKPTHSEVSEIDFTTLTTVPGTVKVHGAPIQILDLRGY